MAVQYECCTSMFWIYVLICFLLVLFAGMMSGLTLGLMSLSLVDLEVLVKSGQTQERKQAAKIMPVVKKQHLLLCTLLICNAISMEALPIFLDGLLPAWGAVLISVTLILLFGEIIPQSICSRYGLAVGATMAPAVRVLVWICFPVAWPISKLLDFLLGKGHAALFHRAELKTLVDFHGNEHHWVCRGVVTQPNASLRINSYLFQRDALIIPAMGYKANDGFRKEKRGGIVVGKPNIYSQRIEDQAGKGGELTHDETTIIAGALELTEKTAENAMTPISEIFAIDVNAKLDKELMVLILQKGHSRVPLYYEQPTNIIGLVLVKNLLSIHPGEEVPMKNVTIRKIPRVPVNMPLYDILNEFQKGHSHMAVVVRYTGGKEQEQKMTKDGSNQVFMQTTHAHDNGKDVNIIVDKSPSQIVQEKSFSNRRSLNKQKSFPATHASDSNRGMPKAKRWSRVESGDILDISNDSIPKLAEDEEIVGIITMEDLIEELLQEEIFDETDLRDSFH